MNTIASTANRAPIPTLPGKLPKNSFLTRMVPAVGAAIVFSLMLFCLLYSAIHVGKFVADKSEVLQTIDFVRLRRDSETETMQRRKPPPPPAPPPPPSKMKVVAEASSQGMTGMAIPTMDLSASVTGGPMAGAMGKGGGAAMFDGDLLPLQRLAPAYPRDAARAGITGWVQLEVTVNADGSVRGAKVTDAKPKGIFEAAAVQAVMRWKFKPKIQDGKPVEQKGSQKIEFNLNAPKP